MGEKIYEWDIPLASCPDCPNGDPLKGRAPHISIRDDGEDDRGPRFLMHAGGCNCWVLTCRILTRPGNERRNAEFVSSIWNELFAKFGIEPKGQS